MKGHTESILPTQYALSDYVMLGFKSIVTLVRFPLMIQLEKFQFQTFL